MQKGNTNINIIAEPSKLEHQLYTRVLLTVVQIQVMYTGLVLFYYDECCTRFSTSDVKLQQMAS